MELTNYLKSIIDEDRCAVVICNLSHEIIYMNPAAVVYMVALRNPDGTLIGYYEKHEYRNRETANLYDFTAG